MTTSISVPSAFTRLDADAARLLTAWAPPDAAQAALRQRFLEQVHRHPGATWRHGPAEHLTASALILDATLDQVLLTLHKKARIWVQVGGHLEETDHDVHAAATREAREESGIAGLTVRPGLVQLHEHALPAAFGRCRAHLDLRFAARATPGAVPVASEESEDLAWWPVDALPERTDPDMHELVDAARSALG
ncbi:NUDIX domain-containing protein [Luteipulveratus sp. YIM 133132]|uniref:NUDIX domain-containing protein n=1 Tax=Luteipulveratus flavus TaxID=3031728 RepID=A0ABT6C952_9MICO|nr:MULTISPECIES: NUDIX domain-containing protein [unclassified Luteipulveratus]MDE9365856.1 NUDIX domain-containing protein [Luteipulveratus sp. YIM 133132]MDF8265048.1 NUDIX domain-containing protein [Luteipulveratus sp. YIM 133296]